MGEVMMDFQYVPLKEFVNADDSAETLADVDADVLKMRQARNLYRQMLDVWGEMSGSVESYKKYKKKKLTKEELFNQLSAFHRICCTVYKAPNITDGAKWELKVAEWELYDFMLWNNEFHNTIKSVTSWFDQWCFGINKEMLG